MKVLVLLSILLSCSLAQANPEKQAKQAELNKNLYQSLKNYFTLSGYRYEVEGEEEGSLDNIRRLLEAGADPNVKNEDGESILVRWRMNSELLKLFFEAGADPNATFSEQDKSTALHFTNPWRARAFLEAGADPNARDNDERTPLFGKNDPEVIRALLEAGADPNAQDSNGNTPLHVLRVDEKGELAAGILIRNGADPKLKNHKGNIPFIVKTAPLAFEQKEESSCRYISESSQIKPVQCSQRNVCMSEMLCTFAIGMAPNTAKIEKIFQAVCSSLSNGQCPKANDCILDRSVVEAKTQTVSSSSSSSTDDASKKSSSGVR